MDRAIRISNSLHEALRATANLYTQLDASPENVFIHTHFARDIAAKLVEALADAAALHKIGSITLQDVETFVNVFHERNYKNVVAVHRDSESLLAIDGSSADKRIQPEFVSTTDSFALDLTRSLSQVIDLNVLILQQCAQPPTIPLSTSRPQFTQYLAGCLRQTIEAHVSQSILYNNARTEVEKMEAECAKLKEAFSAQVADLQHELAQVQEEKTRLISEKDQLQDQLKCTREGLSSEAARVKVNYEQDVSNARATIERLSAEILAQRSNQSYQLMQMQATLDKTHQEAEWNRKQAVYEGNERKRIASEKNALERQIEELKSKLRAEQVRQKSKERKNAEVQTPLMIRVPSVQTPVRNAGVAASVAALKRSYHARTEENNGEATHFHYSCFSAINGAAPPQHRAAELAALPVIDVDLSSSDDIPAVFTRPSLNMILGSADVRKVLTVRVKYSTPLASQYNIQAYLCATWDRYTWLPTEPGKHGFLPYDLEIRKDQDGDLEAAAHGYRRGEIYTPCHLFVGTRTDSEIFHYHGLYQLTKVDSLTKDEWALLPENAKTYCLAKKLRQLVKEIGPGKTPSLKDLRQKFDHGTIAAPCIRLECIEFDPTFYGKLVARAAELLQNPEEPSEEHNLDATPSKRRRLSDRHEDSVQGLDSEDISPHNIDDMYA
ncbi:hypothetical protein L226DRAFT_609717 [Lentinus tigrinus ALCF2SS1-7]|uniref:DUF6697 domain-containing protein n=1 Tax=Lentinus tigrinus ALCF2SS1-6 TaxID=1328759 RepID=A0A5C2SPY1_9APHY|nr:hypothetical protein L227DRAFT_649506 [Lentinus tigrinus ALCF2SS1-6]RPD79199.1 hypothetical protein L226DRAFT_609717 [Lentinus tigrinus ALCF2SS1-7]